MPAVSKKQQRFFGMVRAAQKGEGASSPEVAKVADEISDKDAKKFAKTKHKGLPEKKKMKESFTPHKMIDPSTKKEYWADTYDKHLKYKKMGYVHEEKKPRNCGCGKDPCITYGKKKEIKEEKKGRHPRDQKELDRAVAYIKKNPNFGKKDVKEDKLPEGDVPRGPGGNPIRIKDKIKAAKGFIPHKGKPTPEVKESVLDLVRKYGKKKKEKQPEKAQDAGSRARRVLQRKEYASKVSGSTDNVPDDLRDSLQILKRLIK